MSDILSRCRVEHGLLFIDNTHGGGSKFHASEVELYHAAKLLALRILEVEDELRELQTAQPIRLHPKGGNDEKS